LSESRTLKMPQEIISCHESDESPLECTAALDENSFAKPEVQALHSNKTSQEWRTSQDGSQRLIETNKVPLKDSDGNSVGEVKLTRDITAVKQLEKKLQSTSGIIGYLSQLATSFIDIAVENIDKSLGNAIAEIGTLLEVDQICTHIFDPDKTGFSRLIQWNAYNAIPVKTQAVTQLSSNFPWLVERMSLGEIVILDRNNRMPDKAENTMKFLQDQGVVSALILPLVRLGSVDGFLCIESFSSIREWTEDQIVTFKLFASIVAGALKHKASETILIQTEERLRLLNASLESQVMERTRSLEESIEKLKMSQEIIIQHVKMSSIGQLATGVAHEINNPTGYIMSNLNIFRDYFDHLMLIIDEYDSLHRGPDRLAGNSKEALAKIATLKQDIDFDFVRKDGPELLDESLQGTERIKGIVQALQSYSSNSAKDKKAVLMDELLDRAIKLTWNELKYKCEINKDYGTIPATAGRENQLLQVFINLLLNAVQSINKKGSIFISTASNESSIIITIRDTGSGIPSEHLIKIMDPFFTTKPVGQGTGLGLYISQGIINDHDGTIIAKSTVGVGTAFTITLPLIELPESINQ
jgi:signal transduction histidine kinase